MASAQDQLRARLVYQGGGQNQASTPGAKLTAPSRAGGLKPAGVAANGATAGSGATATGARTLRARLPGGTGDQASSSGGGVSGSSLPTFGGKLTLGITVAPDRLPAGSPLKGSKRLAALQAASGNDIDGWPGSDDEGGGGGGPATADVGDRTGTRRQSSEGGNARGQGNGASPPLPPSQSQQLAGGVAQDGGVALVAAGSQGAVDKSGAFSLEPGSFIQSLALGERHVGNLEAGGFVLLKRREASTAIYQLSVAKGPGDVDPANHCTFSLSGVTVVTHGDAVFVGLERFEYEFSTFKEILRTIPFFRRFRLWKQFTVWKKSVRRGKMAAVAEALTQSIRFLPTIVPALTAVHGHCDDIENARLIGGIGEGSGGAKAKAAAAAKRKAKEAAMLAAAAAAAASGPKGGGLLFGSGGSVSSVASSGGVLEAPSRLEKFLAEQERVRDAMRTDLEDFYATILQLVTEACDTTVNAFLEEMQIEADHPMTFMDRAALRSKLRRLTQFMRFVDLMAVSSLRSLAIESMRDLATAVSVAKAPRAPTAEALEALADAAATAPLPPPPAPKDAKGKAQAAAIAAAKAKAEAEDKEKAKASGKKDEPAPPPEPRPPLKCKAGEEGRVVICASAVRFGDDLEALGDPEQFDLPPPVKAADTKYKASAAPKASVAALEGAGAGGQSKAPVFLIRADIRERKRQTASSALGALLGMKEELPAAPAVAAAPAKGAAKPAAKGAAKGAAKDAAKDDDAAAAKAKAEEEKEEEGGIVATVEVSPGVGEVVAAMEACMEQALRLISVPGRIFSEPALDAYRSVAEGSVQPDTGTPLHHVVAADPEYRKFGELVVNDVRAAYHGVGVYLTVFEPYVATYLGNKKMVDTVTKKFAGDDVDLAVLAKTIVKYQDQVTEFMRIPSAGDVASVTVDSRHLKLGLMPSPVQCLLALKRRLPELMAKASASLMQELSDVLPTITGTPSSVEQFVKKKTLTLSSTEAMPKYRERQARVAEMASLLARNGWPLPDQQASDLYEVEQNLGMLESGVQVAQTKEDEDTKRFAKEIADEVPRLNKRLQALRENLEKPRLADLGADVGRTVDSVEKLQAEFDSTKERCAKLTEYQVVLNLQEDEYDALEEVGQLMNLQSSLWSSMRDFGDLTATWKGQPLGLVSSDELEKVVLKYSKTAYRCSKGLPTNPVVGRLKADVDEFSPVLPLVVDLRNESLRLRHWEQIHEVIGFAIQGDDSVTLGDLIARGVTHHTDAIAAIATTAQQEAVLEGMMAKVVKMWEPCELDVKPYKDVKDLYILGDTSEVIANLDDSLVTVNTVLSSRFVAGIREFVEEWRHTLNVMQETLDEWLNVQRNWMYLEAIFGSPDIVRQLPVAAKMFKTVDLSWKATMKATADEPNALKATNVKGRKQMFETHNNALDKIQKSLEEYLETKRAAFPRFYFLSDDELLQILAQAKDPQAVQPHLRKCFDNLVRLDFGTEPGSIDILAMNSSEGEKVGLGKNLKARGNVEDWMTLLEQRVKVELTLCLKEGLLDYDTKVRSEWVDHHPGQVVATVAQMTWARGTEAVLRSDDPVRGMPAWLQWQIGELNRLVLRIRSNLTSLQRQVIVALTTTDVHARDILDEMVQSRVEHINDFVWQQQLRYYWEKHGADDDCVIRHADSLVQYGYEYMGATSRLVITPMTDRCWLTLTASYGLKLGGAPAGPAGTGKTESSKDLAKAMAICCVVFNCSDQIDYKMMGKLFRGLAQGGYWICLDEFNRIDIEVLSVVAQQMVVLKEGRIAGKKNINFMGINIRLIDHHVIITMNPGYAGRTELPDNLQVCFRPVSMMVPNYALIAEIMLFAEGFGDAKTLSRKMCKLYILCSEQLSQQPHYDYGLRAVKSVLVMAGGLKRGNPDLSEDLVLIRALRDSNQPKFLADDIPLFQAIILDLFPGVEIPPNDYGEFLVTMKEELVLANLQEVPGIMDKIIQMYDIFCIRFGATIVGPAMGGKSTVYRILAKIMTSLRLKGSANPIYQPVVFEILNPKCIKMGELYGEFNPMTQEWTDGLASTIMRKFVDYDDPRGDMVRRWTVFDGPIDALWIENMNTVLDDNMTLCLANGERIKLKKEMKCLFEVEDLAVASPATVSRIGVVYVTSSLLGWFPYIDTWGNITLAPEVPPEVRDYLKKLFLDYVPVGVEFQRKRCKEPVVTVDIQLASSLAALVQALLRPVTEEDKNRTTGGGGDTGVVELKPCADPEGRVAADYSPEEVAVLKKIVDKIFCFAFVWSIGAAIQEQDWDKFDQFAREAVCTPLNCGVPPMGRVFDYFVDLRPDKDGVSGGAFKEWATILPKFTYDPLLPYSQLMVPTVDTRRFSFVITTLITVMKPVFLTGNTGTGKTVVIQNLFATLEPKPFEDPNGMGVLPVFINFSAQTSSLITQLSIESKLEKKRKNLLGAPGGRKCVIFVDDVNMPLVETYGAQPPCELLRQFLDHKGFYDREKLFWKDVVDTLMFVGAAPPGGGRNVITPRMTRHCNVLCMPAASDSAMTLIFTTILAGFTAKFDPAIKALCKGVCEATVEIYNRISAELLPTPSKFHYTFNLRDVSKVFQGMLMVVPKNCNSADTFARLWLHESMRVFYDRLINAEDQAWFTKASCEMLTRYLRMSWTHEELFENPENPPIMFVDYLKPGADPRMYEQVMNYPKLEPLLDDYLDEYNVTFPTQMNLVFFRDAILHISRMTRILRQPRGNAMLVGVGGSGKQSSTRISAFASGMACVQIAISRGYGIPEFREDIKKLMISTGVEGKSTVFLFTDSQIVVETMLEDINNVLNSGEIPNLFPQDEMDRIVAGMQPVLKEMGIPESKDNCIQQFVLRVRDKLHIVLGMSPVGSALRVRCRNFPSLISCTTIDWFMPWPESALISVANKFLKNLQLPTEAVRTALVGACGFVHTSIADAAATFYDELRRRVYTTPKSYLDLIGLYTNKVGALQTAVDVKRERMVVGVQKLGETESIVDSLKADLTRLAPILIEKSKAATELLHHVGIEKADADVVKERVSADEAVVAAQAAEVSVIAADAQKDLDLAMPALNNAVKALNSLTKGDITEVKSFPKPPPAVQTVMEGVCIMLGQKPDWDTAKKVVLADPNFLDKLKNYDKDNISPEILKKLQKNLQEENMKIEVVSKVSKAATGLCMWVHAMDVYSRVAKEVEPKKAKLAAMNAVLDAANSKLATKQAELKAVIDKVESLQQQADDTVAEKNRLAEEQALTAGRLERAEQLTGGLGSEGVRWRASMETLGKLRDDLIGDAFLSCAAISYYGPFTGPYRDELVGKWLERCLEGGIPCSAKYSLVATLGNPVEVRDWQNFTLPSDGVSTNNGILVTRARRWPLMIDPQGQANRWIRKMEAKAVSITTMKDINLLRSLENCVRVGKPLLIEDVEETLEPALEPILQRAVYKQGNRRLITIGDGEVDYDDNFQLYMTSKMSNPHYLPEVCIKVTIINFTVTMEGLEDQLLAMTVVRERPDIEQRKVSLLLQMAADGKQLADLESTILKMLSESKGNILDDSVLISTLAESKKTSTAIQARVAEAEKTEIEINEARESYRTVATRGSLLYFVISDLPEIDPMYQYSLDYYQGLFDRCLLNSDPSKDLSKRLTNIIKFTTYFMYTNICRGLFERDKVLFSALLCFSVLRQRGDISPQSWALFIRGAGPMNRTLQAPNPNPSRISEFQWDLIYACEANVAITPKAPANADGSPGEDLPEIKPFTALPAHVSAKFNTWLTEWIDSEDPITAPLPGIYKSMPSFERLLLLKAFREDCLLGGARHFVAEQLGKEFAISPSASMEDIYEDLTNATPCIFILSKGADPTGVLLRFAKSMNYQDRLPIVSLGQGQGPYAESLIKKGCGNGDWVFLQNCMLAKSWMGKLEALVFELGENQRKNHKDFRLYLSSSPATYFPVSVLQNGVKMTNEPPAGVRANVTRSFANLVKEETWEGCSKPNEWKKLLTALCFFHANIQERRKFGPLGWNVTYSFDESDLEFSMSILRRMVEAQDEVPWDALNYITGQINYGGRVTDDNDKVCLMAVLRKFFTPPVLDDAYKFSSSGTYFAPPSGTYQELRDYLETLPVVDDPEIFGMHANANTTFNTGMSLDMMNKILMLQPRAAGGGGGLSPDELVTKLAEHMEAQVPGVLDEDKAGPTTFVVQPNGLLNSVAIVLTQEMIKFNRLIRKMKASLRDVKKAIQGFIVMSPDLDEMYSSFMQNKLPSMWTKVSFATLKSLGSWAKDLIARVAFFDKWLTAGQPFSFALPVFFFPQGFMTGTLQTFARKYAVAIDTLSFKFDAKSVSDIEPSALKKGPEDGIYVYGLFVEGARWNSAHHRLDISRPKEMYSPLPMIHFTPAVGHKCSPRDYACPVYKTSERKGVLSTTGMSTNFVVACELPTDISPDIWVMYGVACLCNLTD